MQITSRAEMPNEEFAAEISRAAGASKRIIALRTGGDTVVITRKLRLGRGPGTQYECSSEEFSIK